jgi:hypothetical protein
MTRNPFTRRTSVTKALPPTCPPAPHTDAGEPSPRIGSCSRKTRSLPGLAGLYGFPSWELNVPDNTATKLEHRHGTTPVTCTAALAGGPLPPTCPPNRPIAPRSHRATRLG